MKAEKLNKRITIQLKTISQDDELAVIETWSDLISVWAAVIPTNGKEFYRLSSINSEIESAFIIRFDSNCKITPHHRLIFNDNTFEIISVINENEQNRWMTLTCKAVV